MLTAPPLLPPRLRCLAIAALMLSLVACTTQDTQLQQLSEHQQSQARQQEAQSLQLNQQSQALDRIQHDQNQIIAAIDVLRRQQALSSAELSQQLAQTQKHDAPVATTPAANPSKNQELQTPDPASLHDSTKLVIGRVEWVWVESLHKKLKARIDTGATLSSIHATKIERFERDGQNWVRFVMNVNTDGENGGEQAHQFEAPLARTVKIRQASAEEMDSRPVVRMRITLGRLEEDCDFSLTDRDAMNYPVLLGRKFLRDIAVVDVALKFTQPLELPRTP